MTTTVRIETGDTEHVTVMLNTFTIHSGPANAVAAAQTATIAAVTGSPSPVNTAPSPNSTPQARNVLGIISDGQSVPPAPAAMPQTTSIEGAIFTTAMMTRNGHTYNGYTQARMHGLQVAEGDLPYSFPTYESLVAAVQKYNGSVVLILPNRTYRPLKIIPAPGELPIDFYLWDVDRIVRCDMYGRVDPTLETRAAGVQGTVAAPNQGSVQSNTGGTPTSPTVPAGPITPAGPGGTPSQPAKLQDSYPSEGALLAAIRDTGFQSMVSLDGDTGFYKGDGFGPPIEYHRNADGSVSRGGGTDIPIE